MKAITPQTHDLKIWPVYFDAISRGTKTFELRKNDRGFHVGDTLLLREYYIMATKYTGREIKVAVTYIDTGEAVKPGYCVMGIRPIKTGNKE